MQRGYLFTLVLCRDLPVLGATQRGSAGRDKVLRQRKDTGPQVPGSEDELLQPLGCKSACFFFFFFFSFLNFSLFFFLDI